MQNLKVTQSFWILISQKQLIVLRN